MAHRILHCPDEGQGPGCVCRIDAIVPGGKTNQQWQQGALICAYALEGRHRSIAMVPVEEGELVVDGRLLRAGDRVAEIAGALRGGTGNLGGDGKEFTTLPEHDSR